MIRMPADDVLGEEHLVEFNELALCLNASPESVACICKNAKLKLIIMVSEGDLIKQGGLIITKGSFMRLVPSKCGKEKTLDVALSLRAFFLIRDIQ